MTQNNQHNEMPKDTVEELLEAFSQEYKEIEKSFPFRNPTGKEIFYWAKKRMKENITTAYNKGVEVGRGHQDEWYLGKKIQAFKEEYIVVGLSRMIYDEDCEGEPEWKITHKVQEVAIAKEIEGDSFQKPSWHKISDLTPLPEDKL